MPLVANRLYALPDDLQELPCLPDELQKVAVAASLLQRRPRGMSAVSV